MTLATTITISDYELMEVDNKYFESYVMSKLKDQLSDEVMKNMKVTKYADPINAQTTYTGIVATNIGPGYTSNTGAITGAITRQGVQLNLRVVEYTKGGKVSRVELQHFDSNKWTKVPRIQIEL